MIANPHMLSELLAEPPYLAYAYSYPHKTAYRAIEPAVKLSELWATENREALFLYLHVPFCEMRCGFCNLFTTVNPKSDFESEYLAALARQAARVSEALAEAGGTKFARFAIGGGTPTYLTIDELTRLFDIALEQFNLDPHEIPTSIETSPLTATPDKLKLLRERGVDRISIGVQSFFESEVNAVGRSQKTATVQQALDNISKLVFPVLNIDLIYGLPGQTITSWLASLTQALKYRPQELYLYPLYVRPLTGIERHSRQWQHDIRLDCYRAAREMLLAAGYQQHSMRMFQAPHAPASRGPGYSCQQDGMVGIGCGARSYTQSLHYSSEYAVGSNGIREILQDYIQRPAARFAVADYGYQLDLEDQQRRFIIQSLLQLDGLDLSAYQARFGQPLMSEYQELTELIELKLASLQPDRLQLTPAGIERSDLIGQWLYSPRVRELMQQYELR